MRTFRDGWSCCGIPLIVQWARWLSSGEREASSVDLCTASRPPARPGPICPSQELRLHHLISLDGIRMRVISTAEVGVVEGDTLFTFTQEGSVVSAHYSGGRVRLGYLVGIRSPAGLRFRYVRLDTEDRLDSGCSECEIGRTPDGRVRLLEHFQWDTREGSGTNLFEEVPTDL